MGCSTYCPGNFKLQLPLYAWNVTEGGPSTNAWMNQTVDGNPNVSKYWTNDGYTSTSTVANHEKIFYGTTADHSAITTATSGKVRSKWGAWPRYEHSTAQCPYNSGNLQYYKLVSPTVSGSTGVLCNGSQRTFSESAFTDIDLEYDWDYTSQLDGISDDDENTFTVEGTSQSGLATVSLTITTLSGATATASKEFWVNTFESTFVTGQAAVCPDSYYTYTALVPGGHSSSYSYSWTYPGNWTVAYQNQNYIRLKTPIYNPDYGTVRVSITNECGTSGYSGITVYPGYCSMSYYIGLSPNPTTGETILTIESISEKEEPALNSASTKPDFDENAEWDLEVYDNLQTLKLKKNKLKGSSIKIQTASWKEGVYVVRVKYKDEVLTGKLVVKK